MNNFNDHKREPVMRLFWVCILLLSGVLGSAAEWEVKEYRGVPFLWKEWNGNVFLFLTGDYGKF